MLFSPPLFSTTPFKQTIPTQSIRNPTALARFTFLALLIDWSLALYPLNSSAARGVMSNTHNGQDAVNVKEKPTKKSKAIFKQPVDVTKVNADVIKRWISTHLQKILPDDDIALEFIIELLFGAENGAAYVHPIREQLNDFVGKEQSDAFCLELWELLLDAQENPHGLPKKLVEERARELEKRANKQKEQVQKTEQQKDLLARRRATDILSQIRSEGKKVPKREKGRGRQFKEKGKIVKSASSQSKTNYNRS